MKVGFLNSVFSPGGLQKGVADGRIEEIQAALAEVGIDSVGTDMDELLNPFGEELTSQVEDNGVVDPLDEIGDGDTGAPRGGAASGLMDAPEIHGVGVGVGFGWEGRQFFCRRSWIGDGRTRSRDA